MTLGQTPRQPDIFRSTAAYCESRVKPDSLYALLHRECFSLFPDELFGDLFTDVGRRSIPPMIVAVVMVLQRLEGLSDREAVDRFSFDVRWKYAAGGLDFEHPGFVHTVLVDMRARLARSERPDRIFEVALGAAKEAGLVGRRRVLDSTALYDAVTTMDTVSLLRSGIRGLLAAAGPREARLRPLLRRHDDYAGSGKPLCDWEDRAAREALVDALARDATALLAALEGEVLPEPSPRPRRCSPRSWARISRPRRTARSASRGGWQRTGSSPRSIPMPATAIRPPSGASTATRATSRSTPMPSSSPRPP